MAQTILLEMREAAKGCSDVKYRETLRFHADQLEAGISALDRHPDEDALRAVQNDWAYARRLIKCVPKDKPPGGKGLRTAARLAACLLASVLVYALAPSSGEAAGTRHAVRYNTSVFCDRQTTTGPMHCARNEFAHRSLPLKHFYTISCSTHRSIRAELVDRGPAKWTGRTIDLSPGAARRLGISGLGNCNIY